MNGKKKKLFALLLAATIVTSLFSGYPLFAMENPADTAAQQTQQNPPEGAPPSEDPAARPKVEAGQKQEPEPEPQTQPKGTESEEEKKADPAKAPAAAPTPKAKSAAAGPSQAKAAKELEEQTVSFDAASVAKQYGEDTTFTHAASNDKPDGGAITYSITAGNDVASVVAESGLVTIHAAGEATITATAAATDAYSEGTASYTLTVSPIVLVVDQGTYAVTKAYNGTTAPGTASGELGVDGVLEGEAVSVTGTPGDYPDANAAADHTITITLSLSGSYAGNYALPTGETITIADAAITTVAYTATVPSTQSFEAKKGDLDDVVVAFDGVNDESLVGELTWYTDEDLQNEAENDALNALEKGEDILLYWEFEPDANASINKNYVLTNKTASTTFTAAGVAQTIAFTGGNDPIDATYGDVPFAKAATGAETDVTYTSSVPSVAEVDENGQVTILKPGTTTITATAEADETYEEGTASYVLTVAKKEITVADNTYELNKVYDGTTAAATPTGALDVQGILPQDSGVSVVATPPAFTNKNVHSGKLGVPLRIVGDSNGKYKLADSLAGGKVEVDASITPKGITLKARDVELYVGGNVPDPFPYDITGLVAGETKDDAIDVEPAFESTVTDTSFYQVGSIDVLTNGTAKGNYQIDSCTGGTITVFVAYTAIDEQGAPITQAEEITDPTSSFAVRFDVDFSKFFAGSTLFGAVLLDGVELTPETDYTYSEGSTIITLAPSVLAKLSNGPHLLTVYFADGKATANFTVNVANNPNIPGGAPQNTNAAPNNAQKQPGGPAGKPQMGDTTNANIWIALSILLVAAMAAIITYRYKAYLNASKKRQ